MEKLIKYAMIPLLIFGLCIGIMTACKSDDDYNPTAENSYSSRKTDATVIKAYTDDGYIAFKNSCVLSGSAYKQSYLLLKEFTDATYDYEGAQVSFTKSSCDDSVTTALVVQENMFYANVEADPSADYYKPAAAAVGKGLKLYVTDIKITPNTQAMVDNFKAVENSDPYEYTAWQATNPSGTTGYIPFSYTSYAAVGFCGTTDWVVGVAKDVTLPGENDDDGTNSRDLGLVSDSALTDCPLPPRADKKFFVDVGGDGTGFDTGGAPGSGSSTKGINGSDGTADIMNVQIHLRASIAFSEDVSADATDELDTIWLTETQDNTGVDNLPTSLQAAPYSVAGAIDTVFTGTAWAPVENVFQSAKTEDYPWDYVITGSGPYYRED